jgi:4-hydroxyphenylpyruvate dioxygenase
MNPPSSKSIATVSISGTLAEKLEAAAAVGFDAVEIFENDLLTFEGSPRDVRYLTDSLGLSIACFQPFRDFEAMPGPQRTRNMDRAERKFDVMQALGTDLLLVCSNVSAVSADDDARAAADLREMAERAAKRGLRIGYEALAWGRHVNRWRHAWRIVQAAGHPALGIILDSFHTLAVDDDLSGLTDVPAEKIFLAQIADAPKLSMDVLSLSRHYRNFPGQGQLPVAGFVRDLLAAGYRGPLSLEVFNDEFRSAPARLMARDGLRSLLLAEADAGAAELPEPPRFTGVEFLEFGVDEASGRRLAEALRALGFRYAGRHKTKSVDLFRQGGINLVLNSQPDTAAAEHFRFHGPSVCAMAFRVDDAKRAVRRAEALLCPEWREHAGPGEAAIPALRAPDGNLIFLVEQGAAIYRTDFNLFDEAPRDAPWYAPIDAALTRIDHVAQALPTGRMDNFVLFYRALFGFSVDPVLEIPDTMGLIRSRAIANADRTIRLPLNISESRETTTGRFLATFSGAGVQHIAMASDDIVRTLDAMVARGVRFLQIPANYYDDIAARWGLTEEQVALLRDRDILFDRDESGDFLHAFTAPFDDRFFFEIVQRVGGYQQYGAANAAVRMAVQAKDRGQLPG